VQLRVVYLNYVGYKLENWRGRTEAIHKINLTTAVDKR
jgi:hypothetical protein